MMAARGALVGLRSAGPSPGFRSASSHCESLWVAKATAFVDALPHKACPERCRATRRRAERSAPQRSETRSSRRPRGEFSDGVPLDSNLSRREIDTPGCPDLECVDPGVLRVGGRERHVLPQLQHRRLAERDAIGGQRDLLAALGGDLGVDVERGAAVGANVKVVHALDGPAQLCPGDRALGPRSTRQSARLRPAAEPAPTSDIRASIDTPYSTPCVIIGAYS